ncbi:MAG: three-Cys-motif partner protein TcmP [Syntrophotaleaceae bacterium]
MGIEVQHLPTLEDDGLITPDVGLWAEKKYRLVQNYASMFTASMRSKWDHLVYVDLFAGAGRSRLRGTNEIVPASPLLTLDIPVPFNQYIFCELDEEKLDALRERVGREFNQADVRFLHGNANWLLDRVLSEMPVPHRGFKVLGFCFADPYNLDNLKFDTIRRLSNRFFDFLVLIPTGTDAQRNIQRYVEQPQSKLEDFLGSPDWREAWEGAKRKGESADLFLTRYYGEQMVSLGYQPTEPQETVSIRNEKNSTMYRFGFYSRHNLARKFWQQVKKYSDDQLAFEF